MKKGVAMGMAAMLAMATVGNVNVFAEEIPGFDKNTDDFGIVYIINTNLGDRGMTDMTWKGLQAAAEKYGIRADYIELGGDVTLMTPTLQECAENPDYDVIYCNSYNILEAMQQVAQEYPEKKFAMVDSEDNLRLENVFSVNFYQNQGSYLAGVAAALLTESDRELANEDKVVGFVGGGENTALDDFLVGYIQGVHSVDPEIDVLVSWIGNFTDTAKGKELATAQANQGADVIYSVAGSAGMGTLDGCAENGVYGIGVNVDEYKTLIDTNPDTAANVCTSMCKWYDITAETIIDKIMDGSLAWGEYEVWGLSENVVSLAKDNPNYESIFTDEMKKQLEETQQAIVNGEIEVHTAIGVDTDTVAEYLAEASAN